MTTISSIIVHLVIGIVIEEEGCFGMLIREAVMVPSHGVLHPATGIVVTEQSSLSLVRSPSVLVGI